MQLELYDTRLNRCPDGLQFKRSAAGGAPGFSSETLARDDAETEGEKGIICRFCRNVITRPEAIIQMSGRHCHVFTNPTGITYEIGCFSSATGCVRFGEPTDEFTWFPGFLWYCVLCSKCHIHLGWYYQSGTNGFYGLILDNLIENG